MGKVECAKLKGKIYDACVQRVLVYGSETWEWQMLEGILLGVQPMLSRMPDILAVCGVRGHGR